jgi:hypothetical protein
MSNELNSPKVISCPSDGDRPPATQFDDHNESGYFNDNTEVGYGVGLSAEETRPQGILTSDRNLQEQGGGVPNPMVHDNATTEPTWEFSATIHNQVGNIGLADGSVQQVTKQQLQTQVQNAVQAGDPEVRIQFAPPRP